VEDRVKRLVIITALALGLVVAPALADEIPVAEVLVNGLKYPIRADVLGSAFVDSQHVTNEGTFETIIPFIKTADGKYHAFTVCGDDIGIPCVPTQMPKGALGDVHQGEQLPMLGEDGK
jgi:hypothetical protein